LTGSKKNRGKRYLNYKPEAKYNLVLCTLLFNQAVKQAEKKLDHGYNEGKESKDIGPKRLSLFSD
jgi:hypothetical protein